MKHRARKRFGQNFLQDESVVTRLVAALKPQPDDQVVEVGPGLAALTLPLLDQLDELTVVEIDRDLIGRLKALELSALHIHEGDVLNVDWHAMLQSMSNRTSAPMQSDKLLRVVGNLPYNIGTPLLLELIKAHPVIQDIHVMLQKEVVDRLHATPGSRTYGRLSVLIQSVFNVTPLFNVPAAAFDPMPKIESAVVRLKTRNDALSIDQLASLQQATRLAFANKRKTLRNNFKGHIDEHTLQHLDIDPQARAETLDLQAFMRLAKQLKAQ